MDKLSELMKNHESRFIGGWTIPEEHLVFWIVESPSFEAYQNLGREPEIRALYSFTVSETKVLTPMEESRKILERLQ